MFRSEGGPLPPKKLDEFCELRMGVEIAALGREGGVVCTTCCDVCSAVLHQVS